MELLIKNGTVVDPAGGQHGRLDVLIDGGLIREVGPDIQAPSARIVEADGCYVMPGFIDLHVHLRDPGITYKETLETGGNAAVRGGVTTVCAMPNTKPVMDTGEAVAGLHERAKKESRTRVIQLGAVTKGQKGEELADISGMAAAGCHAISEDGKSVMNAALYRRGMQEAVRSGIAVFAHCEDMNMVEGGVMNAGERAKELGNRGITHAVEDVIVARDILLAKETGAQLHLCHCSTADSVRMIRLAKKEGLAVTGEVCPHHFLLTDADIPSDDGNFKMNPPLRTGEDVAELIRGLQDGTIDAIATDHAPHAASEKDVPIAKAAFGIVGLETAAALTYTFLVERGALTIDEMVQKMSAGPARILGMEREIGSLQPGYRADVVLFDPRPSYRIDKESFFSKGKNTPFEGWQVQGAIRATIADGRLVYKDGQLL